MGEKKDVKELEEVEKTKKSRRRIEEHLRKNMNSKEIKALAVILKVPGNDEE